METDRVPPGIESSDSDSCDGGDSGSLGSESPDVDDVLKDPLDPALSPLAD